MTTYKDTITMLTAINEAHDDGGYWCGNMTDKLEGELCSQDLIWRSGDAREYYKLTDRGDELLEIASKLQDKIDRLEESRLEKWAQIEELKKTEAHENLEGLAAEIATLESVIVFLKS